MSQWHHHIQTTSHFFPPIHSGLKHGRHLKSRPRLYANVNRLLRASKHSTFLPTALHWVVSVNRLQSQNKPAKTHTRGHLSCDTPAPCYNWNYRRRSNNPSPRSAPTATTGAPALWTTVKYLITMNKSPNQIWSATPHRIFHHTRRAQCTLGCDEEEGVWVGGRGAGRGNSPITVIDHELYMRCSFNALYSLPPALSPLNIHTNIFVGHC